MAYRLVVALGASVALLLPQQAGAQQLTLGDIVASAEYARRISNFPATQPAVDVILVRNLARLTSSNVLDRPLGVVAGEAMKPGLLGRAKERQRTYDYQLPDSLPAVLDTIVMVVNGEMRRALSGRATDAEIARIRAPFDSLLDAQLARSLQESAEKLRRFEIMYGPGSVRLNMLETGLNYVAQFIPGFGVDPQTGPRPFEIVAAYAPTYFTLSDGDARMVSAAETGIRMYMFGKRSDNPTNEMASKVAGLLRPRHVAAGWAFTGPDDVALQNPWKSRSRSGPFLSWGDIKVAYMTGKDARFLVTRQLRFVPLVF
jgi:hypothetical protein